MSVEFLRRFLSIHREIAPTPFQSPIFLTGCMRSGTTFLANILGEHPEILHLEGELIKPWTTLGGLNCNTNRTFADRSNLSSTSIVNMTSYFEKCYLEYQSNKYLLWRWINKQKKGSGGIHKNWTNLNLLNKNVHLINRTDYVMNMFPESKSILIIRSIESQVNSLILHFQKMEKNGIYIDVPINAEDSWISVSNPTLVKNKWNVKLLAEKWIQLNKSAILGFQKNNKERYSIIKYENLVNNTSEVVDNLFTFLDKSKLELSIQNSLLDRKSFNTNTKGNPLSDWKERLTEGEVKTINEVKNNMQTDYQFILSQL